MQRPSPLLLAALVAVAALTPTGALADCGFQEPTVSSWLLNTDGARGQSPDGRIHAAVSLILADVQRVRFTATDAYVEATGVPRYPCGPFPDGNPAIPNDQDWLFRIPRDPQPAAPGTNQATALGHVGVWINGVVVFNAKDARSYNNLGVWNQNAVVVEADGFDAALGHPAPDRGVPTDGIYHHHQRPIALLDQLGDDGVSHSQLLGFAHDGFPIYGPRGFLNADGTGGVIRLEPSYRLRSITQRHARPDGTALPSAQWGPDVSPTYPLGYYIEDFEHVPGLGHLDEHNGRFAVTPEYPAGSYYYVTTVDTAGVNAYPYALGPTYYGVPAQDNLRQTVSVPAGTCSFSATCVEGDCPGSCADGLDDDADGALDCLDPDCADAPDCASADQDADGVADPLDCAPSDPGAFAVPAELDGLLVTRSAGVVTLSWPDISVQVGTGVTHDVAEDSLAMLVSRRAVEAPCVAVGVASTTWTSAVPPTDVYWLVRALNACGPTAGQGWGAGSDGVARAACP